VVLLSFLVVLQGCGTAPPLTISSYVDRSKPLSSEKAGVPYRGVFHVHTKFSHDSSGSLKDVVRAARRAGLDFVVITDHNTLKAKMDPGAAKLPARPLLIFGTEISTNEGHVIGVGIGKEIRGRIPAKEAIEKIHEQGGFAILAHPICSKGAWRDWNVKDFEAIEVYNYTCDFYGRNKTKLVFELLFLAPPLLAERIFKEPREALNRWDELLKERRIAAVGAVDAHVGLPLLGFHLMRYSVAFEAVTLYVVADTLSERAVVEALVSGRSYVAFETRGRARGFSFKGRVGEKEFLSGSVIPSKEPVTLEVNVPGQSEIRLLRNGELIQKTNASSLVFNATGAGVYRVEVFQDGKLWILSNPIFIES
jgi:hypothetical protein